MRWSLPFLLSLLPLGGLAGKLRSRQSTFVNSTINDGPQPNDGGPQPNDGGGAQPNDGGGPQPNNGGGPQPNNGGGPQPNNTQPQPQPNNGGPFQLTDFYTGNSFLQEFDFFTGPDPTNGLVNFLNKDDAQAKGLVSVGNDGKFVMSADSTTKIPLDANGNLQFNRDSVRISSQKAYGRALIIVDLDQMAVGCSTWPAVWLLGSDVQWPNGGEIDIIEGVNNRQTNQMTLHTSDGCSLPQDGNNFVKDSTMGNTLCASSGDNNQGCAFIDNSQQSYGRGFNEVGGGVIAQLRDDTGVSMWRFPRGNIPDDIANKVPNPSTWGTPVSFFPYSTCPENHFVDMNIIADITFCGDWAGNDLGDCSYQSCAAHAADPSNFVAAFIFNSIGVYSQG